MAFSAAGPCWVLSPASAPSTVSRSPVGAGEGLVERHADGALVGRLPPKPEKALAGRDSSRNTLLASYDSDGVRKAKLLVTPE